MTAIHDAFVQVGAARDGLDPYLACARRRGMPTVLVEAPAYLGWRRKLRRKSFDVELAVPTPEDPRQVAAALHAARVVPALVLAGFERYADSAFRLAARERVAPWPHVGPAFRAHDKAGQRTALSRHAPGIRQPRYAHMRMDGTAARLRDGDGAREQEREQRWERWEGTAVTLREMTFPQVVKPVDGGGGLSVHLVRDESERRRALNEIATAANYGGAAFAGLLVEECVVGTEYSLQCLAWEGTAHVLSFCEKVVLTEEDGDLQGFRETGHIAVAAQHAPSMLKEVAQWCAEATGYLEGPFHIDLIDGAEGPYFLEMGFRLSGFGLVALVERATGLDWAEQAFAAHADRAEPARPNCDSPRRAVAQLIVTRPEQLARAEELAASDPRVRVEATPSAPGVHEFTEPDLASLAADRQRHAAILGKVQLEDDRIDRLRARLRHCAAGGQAG
ncbi:ATP-grasp domain-containing protein [Streptomyces sp. MMG1121]|uniref:ATP-grasp domain-containing protein n=1 Tax=Streptomyces sp. MMG1121 TaxID=1415544 RepID=UPI0006B06CBE|nr:ATP-grasp domain-containing protein [Streptomyces sp. MMG1121]KOV61504.1 hypothetical protein ADK64_27620 [Streptomyces sp. MMG1121]